MYHSHHNAADQVGQGLLGAFIVEPRDPSQRYDALDGASHEHHLIINDQPAASRSMVTCFPATSADRRNLGDTIVIRFMNEGNIIHPWHLHGMPMQVVARDGYPLGPAAFTSTPSASARGSAGTSSSIAMNPAPGPSTATSSARRRSRRHVRHGDGTRRTGADCLGSPDRRRSGCSRRRVHGACLRRFSGPRLTVPADSSASSRRAAATTATGAMLALADHR